MESPRILLTGASGYLGRYLLAELGARGLEVVTERLDLGDREALARGLSRLQPARILNAAALAVLAACERDPARAWRVNAEAVGALAASGARLLQLSTDLVFDGRSAPYAETAPPAPLSVYGRTKAAGEQAALASPRALVVRLPLLFGPSHDGCRGATDAIRQALASRCPLTLFTDEVRTPLHVRDAAAACVELLLADAAGIRHLPGPERISRAELGRRFARSAGLATDGLLHEAPGTDALRPKDVSLASAWRAPRTLAEMLADS